MSTPPLRVVVAALPAHGHVHPVMPLAFAARDAGHDVAFATAAPFTDLVRAEGFAAHDVGLGIDEARARLVAEAGADGMPKREDGRPDLDAGAALFIDVLAAATASDLEPWFVERPPDVVVYEALDVGAAIAARRAGIRAVCHAISPRLPQAFLDLVARPRVDALWAQFGVDPQGFDVFTGDAYLDIFPAVLQQPEILAHPGRVTMRALPHAPLGATVPVWLGRRPRPLVYLTLGTVVATDDELRPAIEGLATLDADVLVALGSAGGDDLGPLPPNVGVEAFVDQATVLGLADLVVHHGGSGTMLGALAAGVPQLVLPKGADQFFNTDALRRAELATVLEPAEVTPDAIATAAKVALHEHRPAVAAVRAEMAAMPHPAERLDVLGSSG